MYTEQIINRIYMQVNGADIRRRRYQSVCAIKKCLFTS
ncbi:hypothetical protein SPV1_02377 [Mariprofundus ferrooxydans PV-1]|uniref:Uncharacterized protein n=1 Tax=Mariprofundus ferrooxydans PV-1 TaxID=314345 RepID=Q0F1Z3_9PROT|nr:hypothetical protein SPV1_02377 [Mariprofundus ferrooxydans PV-1]